MLNQCNFIGRLGQDPESKYTQGGTAVCSLSLAVPEKYKDKETTEWVKIVCFGKTAEFVGQYMQKGNLAFVSGKMQTRQWEDQQGNKRFTTEIIAHTVQNLSPRQSHDSGPPMPPGPFGGAGGDDQQVPF